MHDEATLPDAAYGARERPWTIRMREAASTLPQVQEVVDPNNGEDPQGDQLPPDVMFPLDPAFQQQWVTGPGGAQPRGTTAAIRVEAVAFNRRHYEHLAETISQIQDLGHRATLAKLFARNLPGTPSEGDPVYSINRSKFLEAANTPAYRGRGKHPAFTRGHHDAVADLLRDLRYTQHPSGAPGTTYTHEDVTPLASHFAQRMLEGSGWTYNGNRTFNSRRFIERIMRPGPGEEGYQTPPERAARPSAPRRGPQRPPEISQIPSRNQYENMPPRPRNLPETPREPGEYRQPTPADYHTSPSRPNEGGVDSGTAYRANPEDLHEGLEYDPVFGWRKRSVLAALRAQGDFMSRPLQTTDDANPPFNSPQTTPPSQQQVPSSYQEGLRDGQQDAARGDKPTFSDNSSHVSPYVSGYAAGYSGGSPASGAPVSPDVPRSMGGDSGQAVNAQEAQREFQVSQASLSASFTPREAMADPDFRKGYGFASRWQRGQRLVARGSAAFEAGLFASITDRPEIQRDWVAAHMKQGSRHPNLSRRIDLHAKFTRKQASATGMPYYGPYLMHEAATSTDLITDGPGTSPDPSGNTPLNGPGTPPPMGGGSNPARPGGIPPYQGAEPGPSKPVVTDDVMGQAQEPEHPSGPFTQTFSGRHPGNIDLAPAAPNTAAGPGYENTEAYAGDPRRKMQAFRERVQAGLFRQATMPGSRSLDQAVYGHLRDSWNGWVGGSRRGGPHTTAEEAMSHPRVAANASHPDEVEGAMRRLMQAGRARRGPDHGSYEIVPEQGISTGQV